MAIPPPSNKRQRLGYDYDSDHGESTSVFNQQERDPPVTLATVVENLPFKVIRNIKSFLLGVLPVPITTTTSSSRSNGSSNTRNYGKVMILEYCGVLDLRTLASQFADADTFKIAGDISDEVTTMAEQMWTGFSTEEESKTDGSEMGENIQEEEEEEEEEEEDSIRIPTNVSTGPTITLIEAINIIRSILPSICRGYVQMVYESMVKQDVGYWNNDLFKHDVFRAAADLQNMQFRSFRSVEFDNLQAALSFAEDIQQRGMVVPPLGSRNAIESFVFDALVNQKLELVMSHQARIAVTIVRKFCLRFVGFTKSLRLRTSSEIANDTAASKRTDANHELVPQYSDESVSLAPSWPACVKVNSKTEHNHWARHFSRVPNGFYDNEDEDRFNGSWLTPQMARNLHHQACIIVDTIRDSLLQDDFTYDHKFPKIATPFYKNSPLWRKAFLECHMRIAVRLSKGLFPFPNCTGEEMALHNIIDSAKADEIDEINEIDESLVKFENDQNFDLLREKIMEDYDVLMLFEDGDDGYSINPFRQDNDDNEGDGHIPSPCLTNLLWGQAGEIARVVNLHPAKWFIPFKMEDYRNHLP